MGRGEGTLGDEAVGGGRVRRVGELRAEMETDQWLEGRFACWCRTSVVVGDLKSQLPCPAEKQSETRNMSMDLEVRLGELWNCDFMCQLTRRLDRLLNFPSALCSSVAILARLR